MLRRPSSGFAAVALLATVALAPVSVIAGEVDPLLAKRLERAAPEERVMVFVHLAAQVDLPATTAWLDRMDATRAHRNRVVVGELKALASRTQPAVRAWLEAQRDDGHVGRIVPFWIFNGFAVEATTAVVRGLAWRDDVGAIRYAGGAFATDDLIRPVAIEPALNYNPYDAPESGLLECRADALWALGITGAGRIVANIDTGVDGNHPALASRWRGNAPGVPWQAAWHDPTNNTTTPNPTRGSHGTHTMGTVCGNDGGSNQIGMAYGAQWIASNVLNAPGGRANRNVLYNQAIQWCADPDGNPGTASDVPDAVCNSWGVRDPNNGVPLCSPVFDASIDAAEAATVVVVFAAGNEGSTGPRVPADRIASDTNVFAIGSLDPGSTGVSSFSSRGPSPCDNLTIKPEVSARGGSVRSSVPNGGYSSFSGTSMATPHVTGAVALLREAYPEVTVDRVKRILMQTADDIGAAGEDNQSGWGRINCLSAYNQLLSERPVVAGRALGSRQTWKPSETVWAHLSLTNYTASPQPVQVTIQFYYNNAPTSLFILPPTDVTIGAGYSNESLPLKFSLGLPSPLPAWALAPNTWSLRITVKTTGGGSTIHQSDYVYQVVP